jgi:hypothetical protein
MNPPPKYEARDTHTPPRQIRIGDTDWTDFDHATKAINSDRAAEIRYFIAYYLQRPGAPALKRPPLKAWSDAEPTPRRSRTAEDQRDFDTAAQAAGSDRDAEIRQFMAWYLRRPGAQLPARPPLEAWTETEVPLQPRKVRIGDDWFDFEYAAQAAGKDRAELVREFIAWVLQRPGATLPTPPPVEEWTGPAAEAAEQRAAKKARKGAA